MDSSPQAKGVDQRRLALHALRLKGLATLETLASTFDQDQTGLEAELKRCRDGGLATFRSGNHNKTHHQSYDGEAGRWLLTAKGRAVGQRLIAEELGAGILRAQVNAQYELFVPQNSALLKTCSRWQVQCHDPVVLNNHDDAAYDATVMDELEEIHGTACEIYGELERLLSRFARYRRGFEYALARIRHGAVEWFTKPTILSYHTLWFELHEDLLTTLDLDRAVETARHEEQKTRRCWRIEP